MNETNIHNNKNKNKNRSKLLLPSVAVVAVLALVASPLVAMNDAFAALSALKDRLGVSLPYGPGETPFPQVKTPGTPFGAVGGQEGEEVNESGY